MRGANKRTVPERFWNRHLTVGEADQVVTVGEAAEVLKLSTSMIKKLIRNGRLISIVTRMGHLVTRRSLAAERRRRQKFNL